MRRVPTAMLMLPLIAYRRLLSPLLPARCRYHPSCSAYALEALRLHDPLRGTCLAAWRVLRCNPWSAGGVDDVPSAVAPPTHAPARRPVNTMPPPTCSSNARLTEHPG